MNMTFGVYGAGGGGRGILPLVRSQLGSADALVFIDDGDVGEVINGHPVLSWAEFIARPGEKHALLAVANSRIRQQLDDKCRSAGVVVAGVRASNVIEMDDVEVGDGALISPFVTFTSNIRVGRCFHANLYSYVEHDCVIGDYVTFAPAVRCNGNVHIGDHAYIGAGAMIRQGTPDKPLSIGAGAIVGMGAVVTKDVPAGATMVGNPARPLQRTV